MHVEDVRCAKLHRVVKKQTVVSTHKEFTVLWDRLTDKHVTIQY